MIKKTAPSLYKKNDPYDSKNETKRKKNVGLAQNKNYNFAKNPGYKIKQLKFISQCTMPLLALSYYTSFSLLLSAVKKLFTIFFSSKTIENGNNCASA